MLIYCERYSVEELHPESPDDALRGFTWAPVGRVGWDEATCRKVMRQIESSEFKQELLESGFGKGQNEHLEAAIGYFRRISARMQWMHF